MASKGSTRSIIPSERIERAILLIRCYKVILDKDLAMLYGVTTGNLNKAVTRNIDRFPSDFMFRLSKDEFENLKFHFGTSSWGGTRKLPRVFTEQGVAMLSSVLRSKRAIKVNITIMRTFVKLREMLSTHKKLARRLEQLEKRLMANDKKIQEIYFAMVKLMEGPDKKRKRKQAIGFTPQKKKVRKK